MKIKFLNFREICLWCGDEFTEGKNEICWKCLERKNQFAKQEEPEHGDIDDEDDKSEDSEGILHNDDF